MFHFEKLNAWQKAVALADIIYGATRRFPQDERFGLTSQMRRAAVSVAANLAEGASRHSKCDFAHFIEISAGSLFELLTQSHIAHRQSFMGAETLDLVVSSADELSRMLSGLRSSILDGTSKKVGSTKPLTSERSGSLNAQPSTLNSPNTTGSPCPTSGPSAGGHRSRPSARSGP